MQGDDFAEGSAVSLADANINPATGLATDYLNHFNGPIMPLELLSICPDCRDDFLAWRPMSYCEHFEPCGFKGGRMAIAAYDAGDPAVRACLDTLAGTINAVLEATRAGAVIKGEADSGVPTSPQTVVDSLMKRLDRTS